ncbi:Hypothetical protein PHPALM_13994 [Phytophthora palmivora]|uniref:Uncharacterized protein n=1 Tax=Phytophthora palmivora TaxID=4796 RepID=A0A2P4XVX5_9STRA|nr:Hypothetical protein PHPALM_13994 [Phytophthora palmivora]
MIDNTQQDRYDFDEALLPEGTWVCELENDEYEVEKIADTRSGRPLLFDYLRDRTNRNRFKVMQSHEEPYRGGIVK